jgi:hypothetical protein
MKSPTVKNALRRQYKKDTLYVLDLYTLTYDSHETVDSLGEYVSNIINVSYVGSRYLALSWSPHKTSLYYLSSVLISNIVHHARELNDTLWYGVRRTTMLPRVGWYA